MDIKELSAKYAEQNVNSILTNALQNAYEAGYRQALADVNNSTNQEPQDVKFIDLGLPSGTLWATATFNATFGEAMEYSIPSHEDVAELNKICMFGKLGDAVVRYTGINGNIILFRAVNNVMFWVNQEYSQTQGYTTKIPSDYKMPDSHWIEHKGNRYPVVLVKKP